MVQKIFSQLEKLARRIQLRYMASRVTKEVIEPGRIRFHPQDARKWILKEYQRRLREKGIFFEEKSC